LELVAAFTLVASIALIVGIVRGFARLGTAWHMRRWVAAAASAPLVAAVFMLCMGISSLQSRTCMEPLLAKATAAKGGTLEALVVQCGEPTVRSAGGVAYRSPWFMPRPLWVRVVVLNGVVAEVYTDD